MRIGMVVPYDLSEEGGVKRHAVQLAAALRTLGDEVDVIGPSSRVIADDGVHTFRGVVNIERNGSANHIGIFVCPHLVRRLFRERRYDVMHVHEPLTPSLNYWALWSAGAAARVGTFHAFSEHEELRARTARRVWSAVAFRSYDRGIAVSPAAARFARTTFDKPLAIIPNGIVASVYRRPPGIRSPGEPIRLLFVGHWRDVRKGLRYLIDACTRLTARGIAWTLDVVGDGGQQSRVELANVRYHGAIASEAELGALYAACDVFVAPSTGSESFGIVLLEAMAAGRAIVCSDIEGYRDVVGGAALLVPPENSEALTAGLARIAADRGMRDRLGALGRDRVRAYEWSGLALRVRDEYIAALASRRGEIAARKHVLASTRIERVAGDPRAGN